MNGQTRFIAGRLLLTISPDNPIGTGFSYTFDNGFATSDQEIADSLVRFFTQFFNAYPQYQTTPFWMATESYGGKMTAVTAVALHKAIQSGKVKGVLRQSHEHVPPSISEFDEDSIQYLIRISDDPCYWETVENFEQIDNLEEELEKAHEKYKELLK